mmetsp:Transcript_21052/g.51894  ORF Transcript_21052/g.51894 Transcript_21052/m.51894 type:complete len:128 (-) Transcript_21052:83-466(-)
MSVYRAEEHGYFNAERTAWRGPCFPMSQKDGGAGLARQPRPGLKNRVLHDFLRGQTTAAAHRRGLVRQKILGKLMMSPQLLFSYFLSSVAHGFFDRPSPRSSPRASTSMLKLFRNKVPRDQRESCEK